MQNIVKEIKEKSKRILKKVETDDSMKEKAPWGGETVKWERLYRLLVPRVEWERQVSRLI